MPADPALLWRKNDYLAYAVGHDEQAIMLRGKPPVLLPGFVGDFISGCDVFLPLNSHIHRHAEKYAWGSLELEALRSWLAATVDCGALVSSADVFSACTLAKQTSLAPSLDTICFPTGGDRAGLIKRAIESFGANAAAFERRVRFFISDGSRLQTQRDAFRQVGRHCAVGSRLEVLYAGEEEKRRFASELVRRGCDQDAVEFALFDPLDIGFTCGANRNAMLLHQAGKAFCSVDDDVLCELAAAPPASKRLRLFSTCDPFIRWLFPDQEAAFAHAGALDLDFLATHEALLGRSLGELCGGIQHQDLDLSLAGDDLLRRLWMGESRIRASFSGHFGDPGIPTSTYYLFYEGENRARLTRSESHYRGVLAARSVFVLAPCASVGDSSTSPGMAMGLDHRELLPPFFPVLHAEDFIYGAVLWLCDRRGFLGHSPVAIRHEPRPGKTILQPSELGPDKRAVLFEFAHLMRRVLLRFQRNESDSVESRMRQLGAHLRSIAEQPFDDFVETIRAQLLEQESARLDHIEQQLRDDTDSPDFWRDDLEAYLAHVRESLTEDNFDIPLDLKSGRAADENRKLMRDLISRYGRLLEEWPRIVAAAKEINACGEWAADLRT
jgi:hypothetical protein